MGLEWACISAATRSTSMILSSSGLCAEKDIAVRMGGVVAVVHQLGVSADLAVVACDELEKAQDR